MAPKPNYYQLTPLVFNQDAPTPLTLEVRFDAAPSSVKIQLVPGNPTPNTLIALTPDASGKLFTGSLPAALLSPIDDSDVHRRLVGELLVTLGAQTDQSFVFGDVLTNVVPPISIQAVAPDVQYSDHLVNIRYPGLGDDFGQVALQLTAIAQKFFTHFDDEYDFLQIVFSRAYGGSQYHSATRNDVQGTGKSLFNTDAQYGSAGRLLGLNIHPTPTQFDGASPSAVHELAHQWIAYLGFAPLQQAVPHWPLSDLASDIMGYTRLINGQNQSGQFDFELQPLGGGSYKMVPNNQPKTFSDLSLYLMGMLPANQVGAHFIFDNQAQTIAPNATLAGPVSQVTISDVITHAGARSPDAAHSQKRFRVATILVTKMALTPADSMRLYDMFAARAGATTLLAYKDGFIKGTARPFKLLTNGAGRLDPRIKRHILIDASRDGGVWWFPQQGPFVPGAPHQGKQLADHLRSLGHRVRELPGSWTVTSALLADYDVVIRVNGKGPYSAAEIGAYDDWVKNGGGLLLLSESQPHDALALHFGLKFQGNVRGKQMLSSFAPDPLTSGVVPIHYSGGSGLTAHPATASVLGWLSADSFLDLNDNGVRDPGEPSAPAALGVLPLGLGRIVFCGDSNLWEEVPQPLIKNTLGYFASP